MGLLHEKRIAALCLSGFLLFSCNACAVRNVTAGMEEGEHYDAVISIKEKGTTETETESAEAAMQEKEQLKELTSLIGKNDEEAAGLFGGGEENLTADGSYLVGRNYSVPLFDETCSVYTSYDETGAVFMVLVQFPGTDAEVYRKQLEAVTGEEGGKPEEDAAEGESWQWNFMGCQVTLYAEGGAVSMDLMAEQQ